MRYGFRFIFQLTSTLVVFSCIANAQTGSTEKVSKPDVKSIKSIIEVVDFSGAGSDEIFPENGGWIFVGPNREITIKNSQKVVGYGSAVFGTSSGTSRIAVSLCYQKLGDKPVISFAGDNHLIADADSLRRTFAVSVATTLTEGKYSVGYCIVNRGPQALDNNNYVNGWIMVIN